MGVLTEEKEYVSASLTPERLFKALVLDGYNLIPKVAPTAVKSTEILEGDGGVGTIKKINFEGSNYAKQKTEVVDKDNLSVSFTLIEGDGLSDTLEKITYENKFVAAPGGGTIIKMVRKYYTKGDDDHGIINEGKVKERRDRSFQVFKNVEKYLLENPDAYN